MARTTFATPAAVEVDINGEVKRFHPISSRLAFELRIVALPLARALTVLFGGGRGESGTIDRRKADGETEFIAEAITPELFASKANARAAAASEVVDALTSPEAQSVLARVIINSMKDDFPRGAKDNPTPEQFLEEVDLPLLAPMLRGVFEANKAVLGPLAGKIEQMGLAVGRSISEAAANRVNAPSPIPTPAG